VYLTRSVIVDTEPRHGSTAQLVDGTRFWRDGWYSRRMETVEVPLTDLLHAVDGLDASAEREAKLGGVGSATLVVEDAAGTEHHFFVPTGGAFKAGPVHDVLQALHLLD
jgi:hypothetical protein